MKETVSLFLILLFFACNMTPTDVSKKAELLKQHRDSTNLEFSDPEQSPLTEDDLLVFQGLDYFDFDDAYIIEAKLTLTENESVFGMKTTTDRLPQYRKYGIAEFELNDEVIKLSVYQNIALLEKEDYKDYLFIPFKDATNGKTTYGGGRFLESSIPEGDTIILDFNYCYNPYCAYNHKYSCPIPPIENHIEISIEAGEKNYKEH